MATTELIELAIETSKQAYVPYSHSVSYTHLASTTKRQASTPATESVMDFTI